METAPESQKTVELKLIRPKSTQAATLFTILALLLFLTLLALGTGYLWGKFQSLPQKAETEQKAVDKKEAPLGKLVYTDAGNGFSLYYPDSWQATKRAAGVPGLVLTRDSSSIEIWLAVSQPVILSSEQKEALVTTNQLTLKVDTRAAKMTEYIYSAGNYFSIITLSAQGQKPLVTFWIKTENQEVYTQAKEIAQSLTFD